MRKDNKGLTLIELLVVIAIMGVFIGVFGFSLSMISHKRVSNNANSIKQTIQLAQTYNKSQGNTEEVAEAAKKQRNNNSQGDTDRAKGLCKIKIKGTTNDSSYPYMYLYIADNQLDLDNETGTFRTANGNNGKIRLEKKTTIKIKYSDGTEITIGKDGWADIRLSRTTGGFISSNYSTSDGTGSGIPVKITVTDTERTVVLNLATYTGVVTKD